MVDKPKDGSEQAGHKNHWLKRVGITIVVLGLVLSVLPIGIKFAIEKALSDEGARQVSLEDVELNLFTGRFAVQHLKISSDNTPALDIGEFSVSIDWLPLFKQQIVINSLSLTKAFVSIEKLADGALNVASIKIPKAKANEPETKASQWGFGLANVHIVDSQVEFKSPEFSTTAKIDDLLLLQLFSWKQNVASDFSFDTHINGARVKVDLDLELFAKTPTVKGTLKVNELALDRFQSMLGDTLNDVSGEFSTDINFALSLLDNGIQYQQSGSVALTNVMLSTQDIRLTQDKLAWDGLVKVDTQLADTAITLKGSVNMAKVGANSLRNGMMLVQFDALNVQQLSIEQLDNIRLSGLSVAGLAVAKKTKKPLLELGRVAIDVFQLANFVDIEIDNITLSDLQSDVRISKAGEIELLNGLIASVQPKNVEAKAKVKEQSVEKHAPLLKVRSIKLLGDNEINITSATVGGSIKKKIKLKKFKLGKLNNQAPNFLTPLVLKATINKHSMLSMTGKVAPFSDKVNAQIKTKLSAFELPDFSPMIRQELGYNIESGQLNADIRLDIKQNVIDGNAKVDIHGLVMKPADEGKMAKMTQQLSMPLDSALSLLRDDNDNISLEIPITGDLAKPDFDIADVINTALGNALQGTVKNVLKYALQPYGLIFMAAETAYGAATAIRLDAIEFAPGQSTLPEAAVPYIAKIGELMGKRPNLRIRLCGVATARDVKFLKSMDGQKQPREGLPLVDREEYQEGLLNLAKQRALTIKSKLATDYKIDATRLFNCLPIIAKDDDKPRVEILI